MFNERPHSATPLSQSASQPASQPPPSKGPFSFVKILSHQPTSPFHSSTIVYNLHKTGPTFRKETHIERPLIYLFLVNERRGGISHQEEERDEYHDDRTKGVQAATNLFYLSFANVPLPAGRFGCLFAWNDGHRIWTR